LTASSKVAVVAAGGTGGHLFPAEALARALEARGWRVVLATDARGAQYAQQFPAEERLALEAATFSLMNPVKALQGGLRILAGVSQAKAAFRRLKPAVVIGFGGYPSLPALLAAKDLKIPTIIHEQNAVFGRTNRFLAGGVSAVACAFPTLMKASAKVKKALHVVGNPVRPDIQALYERQYEAPEGTLRLLVTGGSQGARLLSELVPDAMAMIPEDLRTRLRVEQQTRVESLDFARRAYREAGVEAEIAPFFRNMAQRLSSAHLVIGRAGASTVCELAVAGVPSILVPLAIAADDHQTYNAKLLADAGAAVILKEDGLTAEALAQAIQAMAADGEALKAKAAAAHAVAKPDAADRLADLVEGLAKAS
jgi:UDP-N-acetylglucosamine--N-acetylmuramyl-(pentapeptide) pyrophosphoryl-undecaprenol N-acetylglucosamine transferase